MGYQIDSEVRVGAVIETKRLKNIEEKYIPGMWEMITSDHSELKTVVDDLREDMWWNPTDSYWVSDILDEYFSDEFPDEISDESDDKRVKLMFDACLKWKSDNVYQNNKISGKDHIIFITRNDCLGVDIFEQGSSNYSTMPLDKFMEFVEVEKAKLETELAKLGLTENDYKISICNNLHYY